LSAEKIPAEGGHAAAVLEGVSDALSQPLFAITANADAIARLVRQSPRNLAEIQAALAEMAVEALRVQHLITEAQRRLASLRQATDGS
jgi:hypothetical protein